VAKIALIAGMALAGAALSVMTGGLGTFAIGAWAADIIAGASVGASAGALLGNIIFPTRTNMTGPNLNNLLVTTATNGSPIPIPYGEYRYASNIIWSPGLTENTVVTSSSSKGGPTTSSTAYFYSGSFAAAWGEGPATILKIWFDSKVVFDITGLATWHANTTYASGSVIVDSNGNQQLCSTAGTTGSSNPDWRTTISTSGQTTGSGTTQWTYIEVGYPAPTFYPGDEAQYPDPLIQSFEGVNATSGYRGICYAVWEDFPLADFGNRIPNSQGLVQATLGT
jgi:hypothetical protein